MCEAAYRASHAMAEEQRPATAHCKNDRIRILGIRVCISCSRALCHSSHSTASNAGDHCCRIFLRSLTASQEMSSLPRSQNSKFRKGCQGILLFRSVPIKSQQPNAHGLNSPHHIVRFFFRRHARNIDGGVIVERIIDDNGIGWSFPRLGSPLLRLKKGLRLLPGSCIDSHRRNLDNGHTEASQVVRQEDI